LSGHFHVSLSLIFRNESLPGSGGYVISAVFICAEYQRLGIHYRQYRELAISFWIKLAFIFIEIAVAIAFGVLGHNGHYNAAAVCEWIVALIYTFYVWSFALDFIPAVKTKHFESQETELEAATATAMEEQNGQYKGNVGQPMEPPRNF
jgi:hypothetical protein